MQIVAIVHKSATTFGVSFPDVPGCIAAGDTEHEALTNASVALSGHLEIMAEQGEAIPVPRSIDELRSDPEFSDDFDGHAAIALLPFGPAARHTTSTVSAAE